MKTSYDIIIRPVITEQSMSGIADKKYAFEVDVKSGLVLLMTLTYYIKNAIIN